MTDPHTRLTRHNGKWHIMARKGAEGAVEAAGMSIGGCTCHFRRARLVDLSRAGQTLMAGKSYKLKKRGVGRFVRLTERMQASEAWATMPPGPRALYIELKRRYNGKNNGEIYLSHRDAAAALAVHRNTVGPWFRMLEERGFIFLTCGPHLGPSGIGRASVWGLSEEATPDCKQARKTFMQFRIPAQNQCMPVTKKRTHVDKC